MKELIVTMIATSSVDSLNPIGITQQFILQGMVKKPRHIWYFILTTGVVNMIFGYLVYYGVMVLINNGLRHVMENHGLIVYLLELMVGLLVLMWAGRVIIQKVAVIKNKDGASTQEAEDEQIRTKIRAVTPLALIGVGIVSTVSELTSAIPYFSFLAVFVNYKLSFFMVTVILVFYNIIYMLPFMIMYFIYIISKKHFDRLYDFFRKCFKSILEIAIPIVCFIIGLIVLGDSVFNLINL